VFTSNSSGRDIAVGRPAAISTHGIIQERKMVLMYQPRGRRLILDGSEVLWDAYFFDREDPHQCYRLFYFSNGGKIWLSGATETVLHRSKKRNPFPVDDDWLKVEVPPLERLTCRARSFHGERTAEQEREMFTLTGYDFVGRPTH
jgi:hypothetical protein